MTTYLESSDDGYIYLTGTSYTVYDYSDAGSENYIIAPGRHTAANVYDTTWETRAYKRFLLGISSGTVSEALLYFYLNSIPSNDAQLSCNLEQINDYETLVASSADWGITVKKDYGACMTYNQAPGWISVDVTTEIEASKADAYAAFRWRIATAPAAGKSQGFLIKAYEATAYKAYLAITLTGGWAHARTGVANASIGSVTGVVKASIGNITGVA